MACPEASKRHILLQAAKCLMEAATLPEVSAVVEPTREFVQAEARLATSWFLKLWRSRGEGSV